MKTKLLSLLIGLFMSVVFFSCKGKAVITPGPANTMSKLVDISLKGDSTKQMSISYMDGSNKHYLKIYSMFGDTTRLYMTTTLTQDTLITYGNLRTIELFYRGSDTVLYLAPSSNISNIPININSFKVEIYDDKHTLVATHDLYFKVFAAAAFKSTIGYQYDVKWDGIALQKSPSYQSTSPNRGRVGFTVN